jgi:molybdenum cofactor sulfurtransferase
MIDAFAADITTNLYGNPHSNSTPSHFAGERIDEIRLRTLQYFNADPQDFDLVFVSNATAAIKLVMDCFQDATPGSRNKHKKFWYGYHRDAHNSLVGVRELTNGNHRCFKDDLEVDDWITNVKAAPKRDQLGLFAYPGQSNMTGRRLPLSIPKKIRESRRGTNMYTLFDAAALATTTQLNLNDVQPDFTTISFYKIFGFPNLGALIVRKASGHTLLKRRYFGGGTVNAVSVINDNFHSLRETSLHERLEDGTLPFHSIFALDHAMTVHKQLFTSMTRISAHTSFLTKHLYEGMLALKHKNSAPLFQIYNECGSAYGDSTKQGSTVAFNIFRSDGEAVGFNDVETDANEYGIFVRSGGLCNPGGIAVYLNWSPEELRVAFDAGYRCNSGSQNFHGKISGVVRVSLGAMTTKEDVDRFLRFAEEKYVDVLAGEKSPVLYMANKSVGSSLCLKEKLSQTQDVPAQPRGWLRAKASLARMRNGVRAVIC